MSTFTNQKQTRISSETLQFRDHRATPNTSQGIVEGHASVFNTLSPALWELGGAREMIAPGAFTMALERGDDVRLLVNHDPNLVLARSPKTLYLAQDDIGLFIRAALPETQVSRDLQENMRLGNVTQMSFAFSIDDASMELMDGSPVQIVKSVTLSDVSIVTYPCYETATVALRNQREHYEKVISDINNSVDGVPSNNDAQDSLRASLSRRKRVLDVMLLDD